MQQEARDLAIAMREGCLGGRIARLHRVAARRFDQALRPLGLSLPQLDVLAVLMMRGPLKPTAVAEALLVERSTISRNLSLMAQRGWVELESSSSGRTTSAAVTDQGIEVLASARTAWSAAQKDIMNLIGPDTPATIDTWLAALSESLSDTDAPGPHHLEGRGVPPLAARRLIHHTASA